MHAAGATWIRARIAPTGEHTNIELADTTGLPVLSVRALSTRPVTTEQLHAAISTAGRTDQGLLEAGVVTDTTK